MSPKNKGKFGKGKPAVEDNDEFVSGVNRLLQQLKPFAKQLTIGAVVVLLAVLIGAGYNAIQQRKNVAATALFSQAVELYAQRVVSEEDLALYKTLVGDRPLELTTHPTIKARAEATLVVLEKLQAECGSTRVAADAKLFHAGVVYDAELYDEAVKLYGAFAASDAALAMRTAAHEGLGYALEAKARTATDAQERTQGLELALKAFANMQAQPDGAMRDRALYQQARVLQALGRAPEAAALYREALDLQPSAALRSNIDNRLAVLNQVAPTAAPTEDSARGPDKAVAGGVAKDGDNARDAN